MPKDKKDNVINLADRRWENSFNNDLQKAFEEVVGVLQEHLSPEIGAKVGLAIAQALASISDSLVDHFDGPPEGDEEDTLEIIFEPDWHEGHEPQPTREH
tara:strand:+ start:4673 stop:4972 length:300 start_codon:yes stop_codon:yes gene_type:complete